MKQIDNDMDFVSFMFNLYSVCVCVCVCLFYICVCVRERVVHAHVYVLYYYEIIMGGREYISEDTYFIPEI